MWRSVLLSWAALGLSVAPFAEIYVVNPQGTGDFPTIQAAIDACADGDVVELTDGTFTGDGNRDIEYGGKAITVRSQSGDPYGCIIDCQGSEGDPHRGFLWFDHEGSDSVLEGVTIAGGYEFFGGAARIAWSSPTIVGCVFQGNRANGGGALDCAEECGSTVIRCTFTENRAAFGGALCI